VENQFYVNDDADISFIDLKLSEQLHHVQLNVPENQDSWFSE